MTYQATEYPHLGATTWQTTLANGLKVVLVPQPKMHKTYASLTCNFGAVDLTDPADASKTLPAGIAHFLEHKLFEKKDYDAFKLFGELGADSNAYTSYTKTAYLFSATTKVEQCLEVLLDFVQTPYFSAASVAKEQGIIGQEIKMYQDAPDWRLYTATLAAMYPKTSLSCDIAGTVASIAQITPEKLMACYQAYYQPKNMVLSVVGNFDLATIQAVIEKNQAQKQFEQVPLPQLTTASAFPNADGQVVREQMPLAVPKVALGVRGNEAPVFGKAGLVQKFALQFAFSLLFGSDSSNYQRLTEQDIIDDTFGYELETLRCAQFAVLSANSAQPERVVAALKEILAGAADYLAKQTAEFDLMKKVYLGNSLMQLNSVSFIADSLAPQYDYTTAFDVPEIIESIQLKDVVAAWQRFSATASISEVYLTDSTKERD